MRFRYCVYMSFTCVLIRNDLKLPFWTLIWICTDVLGCLYRICMFNSYLLYQRQNVKCLMNKIIAYHKYLPHGTFTGWIQGADFWIGAYDELVEGVFIWEHNGVPLSSTFTSWGTPEPNGGTASNCVFVNIYGDWNDIPCAVDTMRRICEYEA